MFIFRIAKQWLRRFSYAGRGLVYLWRREVSFRWEILAAILVVGYAWWNNWDLLAWLLLLLICFFVLSGEILNTILERLMDLLEPKFSEAVGRLKDMLAALVLLAAGLAVVVGLFLIFNN
ncbi:diacylglycerol kinase [Patescibacteria group bacterium]|nr:diacylglycerol kinase [Patescibacteria group bacterium]